MAAITNNQSNNINIGNATEVLANCLLKSHQTYLTLVDEGFSSDLYREVRLDSTICLKGNLNQANITVVNQEV